MTDPIGFIGLGNMGMPMARNLVAGGRRVIAFDRDEARVSALCEAGAERGASPRAIGDVASIVITSLPTPPIVEAVVLGADGIIEGGAVRVVMDMSTTGPATSGRIAEGLVAKGIDLIDAPVSGGVVRARDGTIAIMASGSDQAYAAVEPLLALIGNTVRIGARSGLAQTMKLVNNMVSGAALAITAEAMAMGVKAGIAPAVLIEALNAGSGRNTASSDKFPRSVLTGTYDYGFAAALMLKDTTLFMQEAEALGLSLRTSSAVRQMWFETISELGEVDFTAIARLMEQRAGVSFQQAA